VVYPRPDGGQGGSTTRSGRPTRCRRPADELTLLTGSRPARLSGPARARWPAGVTAPLGTARTAGPSCPPRLGRRSDRTGLRRGRRPGTRGRTPPYHHFFPCLAQPSVDLDRVDGGSGSSSRVRWPSPCLRGGPPARLGYHRPDAGQATVATEVDGVGKRRTSMYLRVDQPPGLLRSGAQLASERLMRACSG